MEVPDQTPSQEALLEANEELFCHTSAIPVQNRLRYLVENDPDPSKHDVLDYHEADELATSLGLSEDEMHALIEDFNAPDDIVRKDEFGNKVLMPGMDVVIKEELAWREFYGDMEVMTIPAMAQYFGMSYTHIENVMNKIGIAPTSLPSGNHVYPKALAYRVRAEVMAFPPQRNYSHMYKMMGELGCTQSWFVCHTKDDDSADLVRSDNGHIVEGYPPESQDRIKRIFEERPSEKIEGEKYTASAIADILGRDHSWVAVRLLSFASHKEEGINEGGNRPLTFYGPEVLEALRNESNELAEIPVMTDDMLYLEEMAELVCSTEETIGPVLDSLGILPERRMSVHNRRIAKAYRRDDVAVLAMGIVEQRAQKLASINDTIERLGSIDRSLLSEEQKKQLRSARMLKNVSARRYQQAKEVCEDLISRSPEVA